MLICIYTATWPGVLVYIKRNVKVVTKCALKNYNKDKDVEANKSDSKNSSKDNGEDDNKDNRKNKEFQDKIDINLDKVVKTLYYKYINFIFF